MSINRTDSTISYHYVSRMDEYEKELAAKRLLVFLAKLGVMSARKKLPYGEWMDNAITVF